MNGCTAKRGCFVMWKMMSRAHSALTIFIWNKWGWNFQQNRMSFDLLLNLMSFVTNLLVFVCDLFAKHTKQKTDRQSMLWIPNLSILVEIYSILAAHCNYSIILYWINKITNSAIFIIVHVFYDTICSVGDIILFGASCWGRLIFYLLAHSRGVHMCGASKTLIYERNNNKSHF